MYFRYQTAFGTFWIKPDSNREGPYLLGFEDIPIGNYATPEEAAQDVYAQNTGWERWDSLMEISGPEHIGQWEQVEG
ncbi:MAG: hypothetical protein ACLFUT_13005 [Desulfobacteraceae bacterium]